MFFFPIRTDRVQRRTPWINYSLIAANVLLFLLTRHQVHQLAVARGPLTPDMLIEQFPILRYYLQPQLPAWWQYITYQFLHQDLLHLIGNMVFLYVFGNGVEDRLGKVGYLLFYLAGGVFAGIGHVIGSDAPVLGASGSVSAVTGAYLALFPLTYVTIIYFFFIIGAFEVSSLYLILLRVAWDLVMHLGMAGGVAYAAHLAGYLFGFLVGMGLLAARLLPREPYDLLALIEHRRRRAQFKAATRKGYRPWEFNKPGDPSHGTDQPPVSEQQKKVMDLRARVADAMSAHQYADALAHYRELLKADPDQVLGQQLQLDVATQLMAERAYTDAAVAYERFLQTYTGYSQHEQVQLMLALIYARYLHQNDRARQLVEAALPRLHDHEHRQLAEQVMAELSPC